jgi:hypothetical protein
VTESSSKSKDRNSNSSSRGGGVEPRASSSKTPSSSSSPQKPPKEPKLRGREYSHLEKGAFQAYKDALPENKKKLPGGTAALQKAMAKIKKEPGADMMTHRFEHREKAPAPDRPSNKDAMRSKKEKFERQQKERERERERTAEREYGSVVITKSRGSSSKRDYSPAASDYLGIIPGVGQDDVKQAIDKKTAQDISLRLRNLLKLPKAHKWVCYEWFYSNIDK